MWSLRRHPTYTVARKWRNFHLNIRGNSHYEQIYIETIHNLVTIELIELAKWNTRIKYATNVENIRTA